MRKSHRHRDCTPPFHRQATLTASLHRAGRILEEGTHTELLMRWHYAELQQHVASDTNRWNIPKPFGQQQLTL